MSVADNLARIRETIGTQPVKLIAVTKNVGPEGIAEAFRCGVTEFGENRVQDALAKREQLPPSLGANLSWHLIGHLQTNKVKKVVGRFVLVHSVDSLHLAEEIAKEAQARSLVQPLLLQVKLVEDPNKSGFTPDDLRRHFPLVASLPAIEVRGLMTIAPLTESRQIRLQCFAGLRALRDELEQTHQVKLPELSMGMTQDWQEAIGCGATMVRLGRAIFGG